MRKNTNDPQVSNSLPAASGTASRARSRSLALKPWQAYVFAVLATCATLAVRLAYEDVLGGAGSLLIFTLPVILSAYVGGFRAGLLAKTQRAEACCSPHYPCLLTPGSSKQPPWRIVP